MNAFKEFSKDYPTLGASAVIAQFLLIVTGLNINILMFRQLPFPDGYEPWLWFLGALATGTLAAMIGKRLSDFRYKQAGTSPVNVEAPSSVTIESTAPARVEAIPAEPVPVVPIPVEPANAIRVEQTSLATARDMTRRTPSATPAEADY